MKETNRGFKIESFKDLYGLECSLQESSVANNIWLGVHENRMHLNRFMVKQLLPHLISYVESGDLDITSDYINHENRIKLLESRVDDIGIITDKLNKQ